MPTIPNFFNQEPFDMANLTKALMKMPYTERALGSLINFEVEFLDSTVAIIDEEDGKLQVANTLERGAPPERLHSDKKRKSRLLQVPHISLEKRIKAASIQNDRATGQVSMKTAAQAVNNELAKLRKSLEATWEIHRLGAIKGVTTEPNGNVLFDWNAEFETTAETANITFSSASTDVRNELIGHTETVEDNLGEEPFTDLLMICGRQYFKDFIGHTNVEKAYEGYQAGQATLTGDLRGGFLFGGIEHVQYRGMRNLPGGIGQIDDDKAYLVPMGVDGMFRVSYAPADFLDTVNMAGNQEMVSRIEVGKYNKFVDVLAESDPLFHNTRPNCIVELTSN